ncbi:MAG: hypothetical protein C0459_02640 [Chitinophaga sp.]|jgi:hypothetical protein|nr:hypothetical protein [Chitinophaga sp.]
MLKVTNFLALSVITLLFSVSTNAQIIKLPKVLAFGNFTYANPQGDFSKSVNGGTGFEVGGGIGLGKNLLYASTGYINYPFSSTSYKYKVVPFKVGIRHYLLLGLFVNGAVGVASQNSDASGASSGSSFLYEVGAGFKFLGVVEIGAAYTGYQVANSSPSINANSILLKAGLAFKL